MTDEEFQGFVDMVKAGLEAQRRELRRLSTKVDGLSQPAPTVVYNIERRASEAETAAAIEKVAQVRAVSYPSR
ncbi:MULTISPECIES: hypothetical protein [Nocardia]|uniref:hypothetical protein n=1 Tax=Nocardia TaxID=1817 RepID=UPI000D68D1D2|nr:MULTISPECIES: hypothetical protein [Nocardia]